MSVRQLERLASCPNFFLQQSFSPKKDDWCGLHAYVETFAVLEDAPHPTHIHFYTTDIAIARQRWLALLPQHKSMLDRIESYSLDTPSE